MYACQHFEEAPERLWEGGEATLRSFLFFFFYLVFVLFLSVRCGPWTGSR